jgi:IS30 family transposase
MSRCYSHFTLADRRRLHQLVERRVPINEMARQLGRHRSTIYREIKRNTFRDRALPDYDGYYGTVANDVAKERRWRLRKLRRHPHLRRMVIDGKEDYGLGLYRYLPEARRKRRARGSRKPRNSVFPASHRISQRPDFVGDRSVFGHWEGDLLIFERELGHANVTSLVERKSRYVAMMHLG